MYALREGTRAAQKREGCVSGTRPVLYEIYLRPGLLALDATSSAYSIVGTEPPSFLLSSETHYTSMSVRSGSASSCGGRAIMRSSLTWQEGVLDAAFTSWEMPYDSSCNTAKGKTFLPILATALLLLMNVCGGLVH